MRNPTVLLGACIVLGGVAVSVVAYVLLGERAPEGTSAVLERRNEVAVAPAAPHLRSAPAPEAAREAAPAATASGGDGRSEAPRPARPPEPQGIEDSRFAPQPVADFSWKYAKVKRPELERAHKEISEDLAQRASQRIQRHFDAGDFEVLPLEGRSVDEVKGEVKPPNVLGEARAEPVPEGSKPEALHLVLLPREAHPDLYALLDELRWLEAVLGR